MLNYPATVKCVVDSSVEWGTVELFPWGTLNV